MRSIMKKFGWDGPYIPMNVKNSDKKLDKLFADDNYIAELKRDGSRYVSIEGRFFSRKKSENKKTPELLGLPVEKTANIPHLHEFFKQFAGMIVEGEIFYPGLKSNAVTSIMGCDRDKALVRQGLGGCWTYPANDSTVLWRYDENSEWVDPAKIDKGYAKFNERGQIHYMVFEMTYYNGEDLRDLSWHTRRQMLEDWYETYVAETDYAEYIHLSHTFEGENAKRALLKWAEDNGEEGIVFKNINSKYQCDKRPEHHWYRVKGTITADVVVMGYKDPVREYKGDELATWQYWEDADSTVKWDAARVQGGAQALLDSGYVPVSKDYYYGWIGSVAFGLYKDGVLTHAGYCDGLNDEMKAEFTRFKENYIGQVIEVKAMERTDKGLFRHPKYSRLREDKNAEDCLWENEIDE